MLLYFGKNQEDILSKSGQKGWAIRQCSGSKTLWRPSNKGLIFLSDLKMNHCVIAKIFYTTNSCHFIEFLKIIDIWDEQDVSGKSISFHNLITWPIFVEMISNFNSMCRKNSKFYV